MKTDIKNYLYANEFGIVEKSKTAKEWGNTNGTYLVGSIDISYKDIVRTFGKPNFTGDGYKTDAEWEIMTPKGIATIYNYKNGKNYLGNEGLAIKDITDWHIGGRTDEIIPFVYLAVYRTIAESVL